MGEKMLNIFRKCGKIRRPMFKISRLEHSLESSLEINPHSGKVWETSAFRHNGGPIKRPPWNPSIPQSAVMVLGVLRGLPHDAEGRQYLFLSSYVVFPPGANIHGFCFDGRPRQDFCQKSSLGIFPQYKPILDCKLHFSDWFSMQNGIPFLCAKSIVD